jgi:hypothetical protein
MTNSKIVLDSKFILTHAHSIIGFNQEERLQAFDTHFLQLASKDAIDMEKFCFKPPDTVKD